MADRANGVRPFPYQWREAVLASDIPRAEKVMAAVLAEFMDGRGKCWPSREILAERCSCSGRYVRVLLSSLRDRGFVLVEQRFDGAGRQQSNLYAGVLPAAGRGNPSSPRGEPQFPQEGEPQFPQEGEPQFPQNYPYRTTHSELPTLLPDLSEIEVSRPTVEDLFAQFWQAYPRKEGKRDALKAFKKISLGPAVLEAIATGLTVWSGHWAIRDEPEFIPYPATWLNREQWTERPTRAVPHANGVMARVRQRRAAQRAGDDERTTP